MPSKAISRVSAPDRGYRLGVYVRSNSGTYCDINKPFPSGIVTTDKERDPGVQRLLSTPPIKVRGEKSTSAFSVSPITLEMDNKDGWFDRTIGRYLLTGTGLERFLDSLYRARVQLRLVPIQGSSHLAQDEEIGLGTWTIEDVETDLAKKTAKLKLTPLEKLLMSASAETVKIGGSWHEDVSVGFLVKRIVEHALGEDLPITSYPGPVMLPSWNGEDTLNSYGRQPSLLDSVPVTSTYEVPTYLEADDSSSDVLWYATCSTKDYRVRFYKWTKSENNSELKLTTPAGATGNLRFCTFMHAKGTKIYYNLLYNTHTSMQNYFNRKGQMRYFEKSDGTDHSLISPLDLWGGNDFFRVGQSVTSEFSVVGRIAGSPLEEHGEQVLVAHSQRLLGFQYTGGGDWLDTGAWNLQEDLRQTSETTTHAGSGTLPKNTNHSGWTGITSTDIGGDHAFWSWEHPASFPKGMKVSPDGRYIVWFWADGALDWKYRYIDTSDDSDSGIIDGPTAAGDCPDFQITDFAVSNSYILASGLIQNNGDDSGDPERHETRFFRKLITTGSWLPMTGGTVTPSMTEPWPTVVQMEHAGSSDLTFAGCMLDRRSRTFGLFTFNATSLGTLTMFDNSPNYWHSSPAPLSGFNYISSTGRLYFRDNATGAIWSADSDLSNCTIEASGGSVGNGLDTWDASHRLAIATDGTIFGFSAPTSHPANFPQDTDFNPRISPVGDWELWSLEPQTEVRIPIADFSGMDCWEALGFLLQACGPDWVMGFDTEGVFYFRERSSAPQRTYIDPLEDVANWASNEVVLTGLKKKISSLDDIANEVSIVPWEKARPEITGTIELVPRSQVSDSSGTVTPLPRVAITPTADTKEAKRLVLYCNRDGAIGGHHSLGGDWASSILWSWTEEVEDVITEISVQSASDSATIKVRGMSTTWPESTLRRRIGAVEIAINDFVVVGDTTQTRVISNFTSVTGEIVLDDPPGGSSDFILQGTTVSIQRRSSGSHINSENGVTILGATGLGSTTTEHDFADGSMIYAGDVIKVEAELIYVEEMDGDVGTLSRGYLGTTAVSHALARPVGLYIHPQIEGTYRIGNTGFAVEFSAKEDVLVGERRFMVGDRVVIESTGTRSQRSPYRVAISEGMRSIELFEKKKKKIDENPFISAKVSEHLAALWRAEWEFPHYLMTIFSGLDEELEATQKVRVVSSHAFPDELSNAARCWIRGYSHDLVRASTAIEVVSVNRVELQEESVKGGGLPV